MSAFYSTPGDLRGKRFERRVKQADTAAEARAADDAMARLLAGGDKWAQRIAAQRAGRK